MKIFSALLALTLATHAATSDPGQVALDFLEKVRDRKLNLEPGGDTALAPQTGEAKRRQIAKQIERLARDLGNDPLEVSSVKLDENYAAVLVRKLGGFDPSNLRVFPIALVKRNKEWEVAPVPASFENVGTGYALAFRKRIEKLENWMLREQITDLKKLREQSNSQMRRKIEASLSEKQLRSFDAKKMGEHFLAACESRDLASVLGMFGGLDSKLPEDWSLRIRAAENAFSKGPNADWPWRLLIAPDVARAIVRNEEDGRNGAVGIACLDADGDHKTPPAIQVVHFTMFKSEEGLWRINPPAEFFHPTKAPANSASEPLGDLGDISDSEWIQEFPATWGADHPAVPQATAESASRAWLTALRTGSFLNFLTTLKLDGPPQPAVAACIKAAKNWREIRGGSLADFIAPLAFHAEENRAVAIYQLFTARDSDKFSPRSIYFEKSSSGWLWTPEPSHATRDAMKTWTDEETKRLAETWQQQLLADSPKVIDVTTLEAPSEEETRTCVESWLKAIHAGDIEEATKWIACLGDPRSSAIALQNLGYEMTSARGQASPASITAIHRGKVWSAAAAKIAREGGKSAFPLYPLVMTPQGPRVLVEIDLFASENRSRDYLNNTALARLAKATNADAAADLKSLLKEHLSENGAISK